MPLGKKRSWLHYFKIFLLLGLGIILVLPWILVSKLDSGTLRRSDNFLEPNIKRSNYIRPQSSRLYSCQDIFGSHQITHSGTCLQHQLLQWVACEIGPAWIRPQLIDGSMGGEAIEQVWNRPETQEQLEFPRGSLLLQNTTISLHLKDSVDVHMRRFLSSAIPWTDIQPPFELHPATNTNTNITLLVRRGNYANPCMALLTMYNVYIVLEYYYKYVPSRSTSLSIVWLDGHAKGALDPVWNQLFQTQPLHIKQLERYIRLSNQTRMSVDRQAIVPLSGRVMIVNTMSAIGDEGLGLYNWNGNVDIGPNVVINQDGISTCWYNSTLVQFRNSVLDRYGLERSPSNPKKTLTLLVRRDVRAHPRSTGQTDRTLVNVTADAEYLQRLYPMHFLQIVSFENMPFIEQLRSIVSTDVLVAVHGAGNIHVLFLPDDATFVEYVPKPFRQRRRFRYLAECLNITYVAKSAFIEERRFVKTSLHGSKEILRVRLRPDNN